MIVIERRLSVCPALCTASSSVLGKYDHERFNGHDPGELGSMLVSSSTYSRTEAWKISGAGC